MERGRQSSMPGACVDNATGGVWLPHRTGPWSPGRLRREQQVPLSHRGLDEGMGERPGQSLPGHDSR